MYLPRTLLSHLYTHLVRNTHPLSPPVLILVSLDPDALCACRILTALLKRDYIPHKVQPIAGYSELAAAGKDLVLPLTRQHGGQGGIVVCLGVGGLVDLEEMLALDGGENPETQMNMYDHGVEVWVVDARRPWNLQNVFGSGAMAPPEDQDTGITPAMAKRRRGVDQGKLLQSYTPGRGGIIVYDDGDIEQELSAEKEAFCALQDMPDIDEEADDGDLDEESDEEDVAEDSQTRKRKTWSDDDAEEEADSDVDADRPYQRRRSNSVCCNDTTRQVCVLTITLEYINTCHSHITSITTRTIGNVQPSFIFTTRSRSFITPAPTQNAVSTLASPQATQDEAKARSSAGSILFFRNISLGANIFNVVLACL
jgi:cell division control protein 45